MIAVGRRWWAGIGAVMALGYLLVMAASGGLQHSKMLVEYEANGVLEMAPEAVNRATVTIKGRSAAFTRKDGGWVRDDGAQAVNAPLAKTLDRAVKFMHTSNPVREFKAEEIADTPLADFGLENPQLSVALESGGNLVLAAEFGTFNNDGLLQYMRTGSGTVYMMSSFVGKEWETAAKAAMP